MPFWEFLFLTTYRNDLEPYCIHVPYVSRFPIRPPIALVLKWMFMLIFRGKSLLELWVTGYHFSSRLTATLSLCLIYFKITWALYEPYYENTYTRSVRYIGQRLRVAVSREEKKVVTYNSKSDLPLATYVRLDLISNLKWMMHFPVSSYLQWLAKKT